MITMKDEEMRALARDIVEARIFTSLSVPEHLLTSVFMILGLMSREEAERLIADDIVMFYEHIDKRMPMCVNGYPIFMSMRTLNAATYERVRYYAKEYNALIAPFKTRD